jgi:hypothetical protein
MAASTTRRKIDQVLASARKHLEAQLDVVRADMARLAAEERELTAALGNLAADGTSASLTGAPSKRQQRSPAKSGTRRSTRRNRNRPRRGDGASKSTAERMEEVRGLLVAGPKSRTDLAAALKVSPARVQQLLEGLGDSVTSRPDPDRRGKLWSIKGASTAASAAKPQRGRRQAKRASAAKPRGPKAAAAK